MVDHQKVLLSNKRTNYHIKVNSHTSKIMTCYASKVHVHHFDGHNISSFYRIGLIKYPPLANSIHVLKHSITINLQPDGMRSLEDINTRSLKLCIVMWFLMDINTRSLGLHIDIRTMKDIITRAF